MSRPITPQQLRILQALAFGALRLTYADKCEVVKSLTGKERFHDLTRAEAERVINEFKRRAGQPIHRRFLPRAERRAASALLTPDQRDLITQLTADCREAGASQEYLTGAIQRAINRNAPRTSIEGERVIEALKSILLRLHTHPPSIPA